MAILKAGTYVFKAVPALASSLVSSEFTYKTYDLSNNDIYKTEPSTYRFMSSNTQSSDTKNIAIVKMTTSPGATEWSEKTYEAERGWYRFYYNGDFDSVTDRYTATDTTKFRTIIVESDQTVGDAFYTWFMTNIEKPQVNIDLTTLSGYESLPAGTYQLSVKAKAQGYQDSDLSQTVSFTKLAAPVATASDTTVTWEAVTNAESYDVYVDGELYENTTGETAPQFETANISVSGTDSEPTIQNMDQSKVYTVQYKFEYVDDLFTLTYNASTSSWQRSLISGDNMSNIVSQTATSVTLFGGTGGATLTGGTIRSVFGLEAATKEIMDQLNIPFVDYGAYKCIVSGTDITLADGSTKKIEDITFDDNLLVWNFYEGKFDSAKPLWISKERVASSYNLCRFDNGSEVGFVGGPSKGFHRIYNDTAKSFTYTGTKTNVGDKTFTDKGTFTALVSQEIVEQEVSYYNIGTEKYINLFANGILTSGSRIPNRYAIKDMKYYGERLISEEEEQMRINKAKRL